MKRLVARLYRRLPLPNWLEAWLIRRVTPAFLVGVVGVVINERGEILLLEHVFHRYYAWGLPGGWLERGEAPDQALRRELREEVGLEVEIEALLAIETDAETRQRQLEIGYLCRPAGRPTRLSYEILSACWVEPGELPGPIPPFQQKLISCLFERETRDEG
jgi:8-oxo-dGTP diphosphatase